jgi:hypothetical protein
MLCSLYLQNKSFRLESLAKVTIKKDGGKGYIRGEEEMQKFLLTVKHFFRSPV